MVNVLKVYQFTNDVNVINYAPKVTCNEDAHKITILVTNSPLHGIGEACDDCPHIPCR